MSERTIEAILGRARRVVVVGLSDKPHRTSYQVAAVLQQQGYEIVPVNPNIDESLGERAYPSLADVPGEIDLVDVFRRQEHLPGVAREAADRGVPALWNQLGLRSEEARRIAEDAGMDYVEDRCLKVEVQRRAGAMDLPPAA
ncbi:MAG: CoA-binding protein [Nitriliruptorales bacterium]|nr:CoA-binding protein [Nitriliruptorales bacterium]